MKLKIQMRMLGVVIILLGLIITSSLFAPSKFQILNKTRGSQFTLSLYEIRWQTITQLVSYKQA